MAPSEQNSTAHSEDEDMLDVPSDTESGPVKPEPKTSPPPSGDDEAAAKPEQKDLQNMFNDDDDEDLIGDDDDGADFMAAEAALNVYAPPVPLQQSSKY